MARTIKFLRCGRLSGFGWGANLFINNCKNMPCGGKRKPKK